ncbi:uncharacterized protein LOC135819724 [Sycon ciliatum]|uniref:uncharacterized protein LOC135819724 n=1 Tax=Sycon ciliatum TaxID=27933 RepID=UPI0031F6DBD8
MRAIDGHGYHAQSCTAAVLGFLLFSLVMCSTASTIAIASPTGQPALESTCMVKTLVAAGVSEQKAIGYSSKMGQKQIKQEAIVSNDLYITQLLLGATEEDAGLIKTCLTGESGSCQNFAACQNGGSCRLDAAARTHVCVCHQDYTGKFCEEDHNTPIRSFRALQATVNGLVSEMARLRSEAGQLREENRRLKEDTVQTQTAFQEELLQLRQQAISNATGPTSTPTCNCTVEVQDIERLRRRLEIVESSTDQNRLQLDRKSESTDVEAMITDMRGLKSGLEASKVALSNLESTVTTHEELITRNADSLAERMTTVEGTAKRNAQRLNQRASAASVVALGQRMVTVERRSSANDAMVRQRALAADLQATRSELGRVQAGMSHNRGVIDRKLQVALNNLESKVNTHEGLIPRKADSQSVQSLKNRLDVVEGVARHNRQYLNQRALKADVIALEERMGNVEHRITANDVMLRQRAQVTELRARAVKSDLGRVQVGMNHNRGVIDRKLQYFTDGCNHRTLGYAYSTVDDHTELQSGQITSMPFRKQHPGTVLRLLYSCNIRTLGADTASRWYFKINGRECTSPNVIDMTMYQSSADNTHVPAVLQGICTATSSGDIGAGSHTISVHVGKVRLEDISKPSTNWASTSLLEVQEMCPPFGQ